MSFNGAVAAHGQAQSAQAREIIGCRRRLVIAVTGAVTPDLFLTGAVTAHGKAQSPPAREIMGCRHRLVIAVTGAVTPDLF